MSVIIKIMGRESKQWREEQQAYAEDKASGSHLWTSPVVTDEDSGTSQQQLQLVYQTFQEVGRRAGVWFSS